MKVCTKCKVEQPIDEFCRDKNRRDGLSPWCRQCMRIANRTYRERNADALAAKELAYRNAHRDEARLRAKAWRESNLDRALESSRRRRLAKPDAVRAYRREWHIRNRAQVIQRVREWRANNPERVKFQRLVSEGRRRARRNSLPAYDIAPKDLRRIYSSACAVPGCDRTDIQLDHIIPIARGGSHGVGNAQSLCSSHNAAKGARLWVEFRVYLARQLAA